MASELRPVMPVDLFMAAIEGNSDVLTPRLGLQPEEPTDRIQVTIEATHSSPEQHQTVQSELQSATCFGDTVLHLLVIHGHNVLALKVFQRDRSLLNAQNKMSETPLHCAAKVANWGFMANLIAFDPVIAKDAMEETRSQNGDTPLHVAAKHGHVNVGRGLMEWNPTLAQRVNNEMLCPLYIAIMKNYTRMVKEMLEVDPTLACIPFSDGMFPVHVSACMGNIELVKHFIEQYPNCAKLLDPRGRNIFHIAAEKDQPKIFTGLFEDINMREMMARMNNETDNEGNTPLHIAAMKGHKSIMEGFWEKKMGIDAQKIQNNEGLTPFKLSARQLKTFEYIDDEDIQRHESLMGSKFTQDWFDIVMNPAFTKNKWEKTQVLGLGSVLITTVTFAAAFTIPGGYNQNDGTPVLGKKYMFRAFIIANTFAFIKAIASLVVLLWETKAIRDRLRFAAIFFMLAVSYMVVAFGLGVYVMLAPICYPIAVIVLVITLITGSPVVIYYGIIEIGPTILVFIVSSIKTAKGKIIFLVVFWFTIFPLIFLWALA